MSALGDRIRAEANIAARPGQLARLERIAAEVDAVVAVGEYLSDEARDGRV